MKTLYLVLRLLTVDSRTSAEELCTARWEPDTDGWWECYVELETVRCEAQGWCSDLGTVGSEAQPCGRFAGQEE